MGLVILSRGGRVGKALGIGERPLFELKAPEVRWVRWMFMRRGTSSGEMMRYCSSVGRRGKGWNVGGCARVDSVRCSSMLWSSNRTPGWLATSIELEGRLRVLFIAISRFDSWSSSTWSLLLDRGGSRGISILVLYDRASCTSKIPWNLGSLVASSCIHRGLTIDEFGLWEFNQMIQGRES